MGGPATVPGAELVALQPAGPSGRSHDFELELELELEEIWLKVGDGP
jgi:hypothetical protein